MTSPFPLLIIEPDSDHHAHIEYSCTVNTFRVAPVFATSSEEAIHYLETHSSDKNRFPRLVLLELLLPEPKAGLHLLKEIRKRYPRLPVIILSNHQDPSYLQQAYDAGANSYVSKPLTLASWEKHFQVLLSYWLNVVTLAPAHSPNP